jgi:hypothetical protein
MNKLSVFFCCHNRLYVDSNINTVLNMDNTIIPTVLLPLVSTSMTRDMIKILDNYLYNDKLTNGRNSLANKIIGLTTILKVSFNYKVDGKCNSDKIIPWSNSYGKKIKFNDQYNLFTYMFNENSTLPPMYPLGTYKSLYRIIVHSALRTMWKFNNK